MTQTNVKISWRNFDEVLSFCFLDIEVALILIKLSSDLQICKKKFKKNN